MEGGEIDSNTVHVYIVSNIYYIRCIYSRREVTLLFFNKTVKDILWHKQLDRLAETVDW